MTRCDLEKLKQLVSEMLPPAEYEDKLQQIDDKGAEKLKQPVDQGTALNR